MASSDVFTDVPAYTPETELLTRIKQSDDRNVAILADLDHGLNYRSIAAKYDVGLATIARLAAKMEVHKGAARKYMVAKALEVAEDWLDASKEAAKKGDHRPAKDWLLHAQEIEPIADSPKMGIQINVGNGGAPVQAVTDIPTISVQPQPAQALTGDASG